MAGEIPSGDGKIDNLFFTVYSIAVEQADLMDMWYTNYILYMKEAPRTRIMVTSSLTLFTHVV